MNLPPVVYSLRAWEALALLVAIVVVRGEYLPVELAAQILAVVLAALRLVGVVPELRAKGRIK